jgi:hypothetical protein
MPAIDVKQAVIFAKLYIADLFSDEGLTNLGLEEVVYDDMDDQWRITLGFSRRWDQNSLLSSIGSIQNRTYKVVTLDQAGTVLSVTNRNVANAA